ncbi:MAG: hypothetical protein AB1414_20405 [bacterium]
MSIGNFEAFMAAVRQRESSDNYGIMNNFGFAGAYQLGELAMIDAGFYEKDGTSKNDWTGEWTQKAKDMGVTNVYIGKTTLYNTVHERTGRTKNIACGT